MFVNQMSSDFQYTELQGGTKFSFIQGVIFLLLTSSLFVINPVVLAGPSTLRIIVSTFSPYYSPQLVQMKVGTAVSWENPTSDLHSITHDGCKSGEFCAFDSGPLGPNGTFTIQQLAPGSYPYYCIFHPVMQGTLLVIETETASET